MSTDIYRERLQDSVGQLQNLIGRWENDPTRRAQTTVVRLLRESVETLGTLAGSLETRRTPLQFFMGVMNKGGPQNDVSPEVPLAEIDKVLQDVVNRLKSNEIELSSGMASELKTSLSRVAQAAQSFAEYTQKR